MASVKGRLRLLPPLLLVIGLLILATAYAAAGIAGRVNITWPLFFGVLAVLTGANMWLLFSAWKLRERLTPLQHIAFIVWGGVAIWYWTFAPLYYALNMHINAYQLAWTAFAFLWEVPVIGGGVLTTLAVLLFRPLLTAAAEEGSAKESLKLYHRVLQYPRRVALLLFFLSIVGYIIGAAQLGVFAAASRFELVKNVLNGPVVAVFLAVILYLVLDAYLDQLRRRVGQQLPSSFFPVRGLRGRLARVSLAVLLGGIGLLGLLVVESFQSLTERQLAVGLHKDLSRLRAGVAADAEVNLQQLARGAKGYVTQVRLDDIAELPVSAETKTALRDSPEGVLTDLHEQGKMLAYITSAAGDRVISVAYLASFYDFWRFPGFLTYGSGSLLVVVLTMGVFTFVAYEITRALISLRSLAQEPELSQWNELLGIHTGDEIEAVGQTFMRYVQKAKEVDEVKREFVSIASHQLRTPLTAIRWYVELLESERDGQLTAKQRENLTHIARGNQRMIHLVNDLLNVSRIDSGRLAIEPQETDLATFIQQLIDEVAPQAKALRCTLRVEEKAADVAVWVDRMLLRQVMQNLLTNALKYRRPEGVCQVVITLDRDAKQRFLLTIEDNGVGIPPDQQHRVFDRFFRADNVLTLHTEGTGLGLYVSKMLLTAAGCRIAFTSQPGQGTTFYITIPATGMLAKPGEISLAGGETVASLDKPPVT